MKSLYLAAATSFVLSTVSYAEIKWRSDTTVPGYTLKDIDNTLLTNGNSTTGFMVQLIRDVAGNGIDPVSAASVNGVSADDVVVDVAWIGSGGLGTGSAGVLRNQTGEAHVDGARYYVRARNAPAPASFLLDEGNELTPRPSLNSGLNSLGKPLRYGNSSIFVATGAVNLSLQMDFQAVTNQLFPGAVPEAGTAGLAGLGMLMLRRFLRRKTA